MSNDTNVPPVESSCYTAPENVILPEIVEEDCEKTARYIWIYQNNNPDGDKSPIVTICEVKIFGKLYTDRFQVIFYRFLSYLVYNIKPLLKVSKLQRRFYVKIRGTWFLMKALNHL